MSNNKRGLKKAIHSACNTTLAMGLYVSLFADDSAQQDVNSLLARVIAIDADYVCRVCHVEPGMAPRKYFAAIKQQFNNDMDEVVSRLQAIADQPA